MMHHQFSVSFYVLIQSHTCACNMSFVSSLVINWQFRRIDQNGSNKPVSFLPLVIVGKPHNKKRKFSCVLHALFQLLCSLASLKLSTLDVRHPSRIPSDRLLFDETFAQPYIFAVVNSPDVALSVCYSLVLTRCRILLQL